MADIRPLLTQPDQSTDNEEAPRLGNSSPTLDEIIEESIGGFGWAQLVQCILVSLARIFDGQQTFISIFTDAEPTWHCTNSNTCNSSSDICQLSMSSWAWDVSSSQTIVSEWDLECSNSLILSLPASSFFLGSFIGCFFLASLADSSLGRKKLLILSCLTMSTAALAIIFSTNVWIYSTLKFISGVGRSTIGTCVLLLLTEKLGKKWRGQLGIMGFLFYTLGYLSLPAIAYINRNSSWRRLYLYTSIPGILYCALLLIFVSESPRWLFLKGREEEAMAVLRRITPGKYYKAINLGLLNLALKEESSKLNVNSPFKHLLGTRWALKRVLGVIVLVFGIGTVYYGIPMGVENLGFNIYLSVMFNALLQLPSYLVSFFLIGRCPRKASVLGFCITSGIFSIMCFVFDDGAEGMKLGMEITSLFCASTAYNVSLIYTTELFPTSVRNTATSMVRQAVALSAVLSPVLDSAGRSNAIFSYGMFGFVIIFCSMFVVCLPETRGATLCDTMDEQEVNGTRLKE